LIINSPGNPTSGVLSQPDIVRIAELAVQHDLIVLSDEIYSEIIYEGEHVSIATMPGMAERTIVLDGFSKTYAMTGWRLGYGAMPVELAGHINKLMVNSVSCTSVAVQRAGIEALEGPQDDVRAMVEAFRARRDIMVEGLNAIPGISCLNPKGAFYVFPNIGGTGKTSRQFADALLEEHGVAALSGTAFGAHGEGYLRLSYANSEANLLKALERIEAATGAAVARGVPGSGVGDRPLVGAVVAILGLSVWLVTSLTERRRAAAAERPVATVGQLALPAGATVVVGVLLFVLAAWPS
jgi:aspartate/methionine/tyrosine aminotransferase